MGEVPQHTITPHLEFGDAFPQRRHLRVRKLQLPARLVYCLCKGRAWSQRFVDLELRSIYPYSELGLSALQLPLSLVYGLRFGFMC